MNTLETLALCTFIATCFVVVGWLFYNWELRFVTIIENQNDIRVVPATELKKYVDESVTEKMKAMRTSDNWPL